MRFHVVCTLLLVLAAGTHAFADKNDKPKQPADGFVSLFDGKTLKGWHLMNGAKFAAKDGVVKQDGGRGWLRTDKEYADFILKLEFRWMKERQDSGVFLRAGLEGDDWPNQKYEVQCENTERIAIIFGAKHERDVKKAVKAMKGAPGQWNSYEIRCVGPELEVKLNGQLVAASKSATRASGYIGFQGENGQLEFRNIRIKPVKTE